MERCKCGHAKSKHNVDASWAPFGCYYVVAVRFEGDKAGLLCTCIAFELEATKEPIK